MAATSFFSIGSCCHKLLPIAATSFFLIGSMADTSFFLIGCMKRQHDVILEAIWETDLNTTRFSRSAAGTQFSSSDLLCFTLFPLLFGQNYSKSNSLSPFCLLDKNYSKSKFPFSLLLGQIILSPIPLLSSAFERKYSKSNSDLAAKRSSAKLF